MDIVEVARRSGVNASTLRYYEEEGLVRSVGRRGLRRLFEPSVLERLSLIALGQLAGFTLHEIKRMFDSDGRLEIDRSKLTAKADEVDAAIRRLSVLRDGLRHAAACSAPSHLECPRFRAIMRMAAAARQGAEAGGAGTRKTKTRMRRR